MRRKGRKKQSKPSLVIAVLLLVIVGVVSIGYSVFVAELSVTNTVVKVRADKVVRVTNVTTSSGAVSELDYNVASVVSTVAIPAGGSVTYNTTVTNLGNVPIAVSDITFTDGNNTINGLTTTINKQHYIKVCNGSNCTGPVSKDIAITVTNNTGSTINGNLVADITFSSVYTVKYGNTVLGDVLEGEDFTYIFTQNIPSGVAITSGNYGTRTYSNGTLTITDVESNIETIEAFTVTYDGTVQGIVASGGTHTHEFTSMWPKEINITSGTYGTKTYQNDVLTITNVTSDIVCQPIYGEIAVTNITYNSTDSVNVLDQTTPIPNGMNATFDITYERDANATTNDMKAVYNITITNDFYNDYIFNGFDFNPAITANAGDSAYIEPELIGINQGEVIPARTSKSFQLVLNLIANNPNGTYTTTGNAEAETTQPAEETGNLTATLTATGRDLTQASNRIPLAITVSNTYPVAKEYQIISSTTNFQLVDASGNPLTTFTIAGETTDTINAYVKVNSNAMFNQSTASTSIILTSSGMANYVISNLEFDVSISAGVDTTPVSVSNATIDWLYEGSNSYPTPDAVRVEWSGSDNVGGSGVLNYTVKVYASDGTLKKTETVGSNQQYANVKGSDWANGSYYAVVYGEDNYHNSGAAYESQADTSPYASKSSNGTFTWRYSIDESGLSKLDCSPDFAYYKQKYTCSMTPTGSTMNGDEVPSSVTSVYLGSTRLTTSANSNGSYYKYTPASNSRSATLEVFNVTDVVKITATASSSCLVEGTKILMANGTYKNIEDIKYDDLVMVHSYDTGKLVPGYLLWIEKEHSIETYQKITFSDGTILKTAGWHGVFEPELNKFVSVNNPYEFRVGSKVLKLNKDRTGYDTITVTNIELVEEKVKYYHIVSNNYYNTFSNDILTTVGTVVLSNLYGWDENVTWPKEIRAKAMEDMYTYDDLEGVIPHYQFVGLRAGEAKYLADYGLSLEALQGYLLAHLSNPDMVLEPMKILNHNVWMVTTSEDNVTALNKSNYLMREGDTYTLPVGKKGKVKWVNTADNKAYNPGDKVTVDHAIYFEAVYE